MNWVADYSFARPDLAALQAAGCSGIIRYAYGAGKALERAEVVACEQLGLTLTVVQEGGNQPALRGYQGGVVDAVNANRALDAVGYTGWLYYVLEDPNRLAVSQWPTVVDYLNGVHSVGGRTVGGYGSLALLNRMSSLIVGRWPVEFWGGHGPQDHLSQYDAPRDANGNYVLPSAFATAIDGNHVLKADYGQHPRPPEVDLTPEEHALLVDLDTRVKNIEAWGPAPKPAKQESILFWTNVTYQGVADHPAAFLSDWTFFRWIVNPGELTDVTATIPAATGYTVKEWNHADQPVADVRAFGTPANKETADLLGWPWP